MAEDFEYKQQPSGIWTKRKRGSGGSFEASEAPSGGADSGGSKSTDTLRAEMMGGSKKKPADDEDLTDKPDDSPIIKASKRAKRAARASVVAGAGKTGG